MTNSDIIAPRISIGLPVYNGAEDLANVLESLLAQDYADFEIILADNASTDDTESICRAFAQLDLRVRYIRHTSNVGALANFMFVLEQSDAEYFLWAAADDQRSPDFLRQNLSFLENNSEYVASTSKTRFEGAEYDPRLVGDGLLDARRKEHRIASFLSLWHGNSSFYSLFRRVPLLRAAKPIDGYLGFDWTIILRLAAIGRLARLEDGWCLRGNRGASSDAKTIFQSSRSRYIHWLLPFYDVSVVTIGLVRDIGWRDKLNIFASLVRLNYWAFRNQLSVECSIWRGQMI